VAICVVALVAENDSWAPHPIEATARSMIEIRNTVEDIRVGYRRPGFYQVAYEATKPLATRPRVRYQEAVVR
jgi:hypothetical protein